MELLKEILYQLAIDVPILNESDILHSLNDKIFDNVRNNKGTVITIDEAHLIKDTEICEGLRLLLKFQLNDRFLMTLILLGQPELKERTIRSHSLRNAYPSDIMPIRFTLRKWLKYPIFRVKKAGMKRIAFSREALQKTYEYSGGFPERLTTCLI